jgi:hypothetical protein
VWQFYSPREEVINHADRYWTEALDRPGAFQAGYLKMLIESRPCLNRIPDQSIIVDGQGEKGEYMCAFRDSSCLYGMIYLPVGKKITVNTSFIRSDKLSVWWFNPRNGQTINTGTLVNSKTYEFTAPSMGFENDWVLVIDDPAAKFNIPVIGEKQ